VSSFEKMTIGDDQSPHRCKQHIVTFEPRQTERGTEFQLLSFFSVPCELMVLDDVAKALK
jgi:hypothetical protein